MKKTSEKILAERMLRARERGGYGFLPYVRMNAKGYMFVVLGYGAVLAFLAFANQWPLFAVIVGVVVGLLIRDLEWLHGIQQTWPFVVKITDWDKVQKAADEKPLA